MDSKPLKPFNIEINEKADSMGTDNTIPRRLRDIPSPTPTDIITKEMDIPDDPSISAERKQYQTVVGSRAEALRRDGLVVTGEARGGSPISVRSTYHQAVPTDGLIVVNDDSRMLPFEFKE